MSQNTAIHSSKWLSMILILAVTLTACGSSKSAIVGKWEIVSGAGIGTIYEFFQDGTVSKSGFAGKYSWPDQTHIKLEWIGFPTVYTYSLSRDELTLTDSTSQSVIVMKRYKEFSLSQQVVAGTWEHSFRANSVNSGCFKALGIYSIPQELILGTDGSVTIIVYWGIIGSGPTMNGQYNISGSNLNVTASGTEVNSGMQGSFSCAATVSNSRLTFSDGQGQTIFVRKGQ